MKTKNIVLFLIVNIITGFLYATPIIILKLDDLTAYNGICTGKSVMDSLINKKVKFSYGVIANGLDKTSKSTLEPYLSATDSNGDKLLEIWNHGLEHNCAEFLRTTYEYQKSHLDISTQLVNKYLEIQMHTFGAPCNSNDSITNEALFSNQDYKVFFQSNFQDTIHKNVLFLNWPSVQIENGTGNPDYTFFLGNYNSIIRYSPKYMILTGHPNEWNTSRFTQFRLIIDFLIEHKHEFVLPYEYYLSLQVKSIPSLQAEAITSRQIKLNWTDNDNLKIGFKIERSEDSIKWVIIGRSENLSNSYIDTNIYTKSGNYYYRVSPNIGIKTVFSNVVKVSNLETDLNSLLDENKLHVQVYPNPGNGMHYIKYEILKTGLVTCSILNLYGNEYKKVFCGNQAAGIYQLVFDSSTFPAGVYLCMLNTSNGCSIEKIVIK